MSRCMKLPGFTARACLRASVSTGLALPLVAEADDAATSTLLTSLPSADTKSTGSALQCPCTQSTPSALLCHWFCLSLRGEHLDAKERSTLNDLPPCEAWRRAISSSCVEVLYKRSRAAAICGDTVRSQQLTLFTSARSATPSLARSANTSSS